MLKLAHVDVNVSVTEKESALIQQGGTPSEPYKIDPVCSASLPTVSKDQWQAVQGSTLR